MNPGPSPCPALDRGSYGPAWLTTPTQLTAGTRRPARTQSKQRRHSIKSSTQTGTSHSRNGKYGISTHAQIGLLRLYVDVGSLDHFRPLLALDLYQRRKLFRCRADGVEASVARRSVVSGSAMILTISRWSAAMISLGVRAGTSTPTQPSPSTSG